MENSFWRITSYWCPTVRRVTWLHWKSSCDYFSHFSGYTGLDNESLKSHFVFYSSTNPKLRNLWIYPQGPKSYFWSLHQIMSLNPINSSLAEREQVSLWWGKPIGTVTKTSTLPVTAEGCVVKQWVTDINPCSLSRSETSLGYVKWSVSVWCYSFSQCCSIYSISEFMITTYFESCFPSESHPKPVSLKLFLEIKN